MARPSQNLLSRVLIARTALEMYDAEGAAAFSLRRLAQRLGVKSPSLYNHISGQDDLVDAMHDLIQEETEWPGVYVTDWRATLADHVRSYRSAYARHPEVALMIARRPIVDSGLAWYDAQLRGFTDLGLSSADALRLSAAIDYLVFGSMALPYVEGFAAPVEHYTSVYPDLADALASTPADRTNDEGFEWALQRLLDGIAPLVREPPSSVE